MTAKHRNAPAVQSQGASENVQRGSGQSEVTKTGGEPQRRQIVQIIPAAPGYVISYRDADGQDLIPPAAAALVEDDAGRRSVAYIGEDGGFADEHPSFDGVLYLGWVRR